MGRPLSVTLSDIYLVKMENDIVIPWKYILYWRFADDIYSRKETMFWSISRKTIIQSLNSL